MRYETHNLLALSLMHHFPLGQRAFWLSCVLTEAQAVFFSNKHSVGVCEVQEKCSKNNKPMCWLSAE